MKNRFSLFFTSRITSWIIRQESEDEERNKEYHYCGNKKFESKHYTISKIIFLEKKREQIIYFYTTYPIFILHILYWIPRKKGFLFLERKPFSEIHFKSLSLLKISFITRIRYFGGPYRVVFHWKRKRVRIGKWGA